MRIINLPRGAGKSTRIVYASEYFKAPILCSSEKHKEHIKYLAEKNNIIIPNPITVNDIFNGKAIGNAHLKDILVDESLLVLDTILGRKGFNMMGCTLSDEENSEISVIKGEVQ